MIFGTYLIVLVMVQVIQAGDLVFDVRKCRNVKAQMKVPDDSWIDELLKPKSSEEGQVWNVKYADQFSKVENILQSMSISILPIKNGIIEIHFSGVRINDVPTEIHKEYLTEIGYKVLGTSSIPNGRVEFQYYILHYKPNRYMYIYKCSKSSNAPNYGLDSRYVIVKEGAEELNGEEETEIKKYDKDLVKKWVFSGLLTKVRKLIPDEKGNVVQTRDGLPPRN